MRREFIILLALISWNLSSGQVNLLIEDQTDNGFFLGINGYLQNPEKQQNILIESLDTVPYQLHIDSDTFNFVKKIHLREAETHRYVLTRNFHGDLKLRYRGVIGNPPKEISRQNFDQELDWPKEWQPVASLADSADQSRLTASKKPEETEVRDQPAKPAEELEIDKELKSATSKVEKAEALSPAQDTLPKAEDSIAEKVVKKTTFESFLAELKSRQYEFEKLTHSLSYAKQNTLNLTQLKQIFQTLSYDQTRLQFLREAKDQVRDPDMLPELEAELEYEISKKEFKKIIDHE